MNPNPISRLTVQGCATAAGVPRWSHCAISRNLDLELFKVVQAPTTLSLLPSSLATIILREQNATCAHSKSQPPLRIVIFSTSTTSPDK